MSSPPDVRATAASPGAAPAPLDLETLEPAVGLDAAVILLAGTVVGATLAVLVLPTLLPTLTATLLGDQPKAFWYLSRSAGVVGYLALWLAVVLGLMLTNRFARLWAGGPATADVHQFSSLLALTLVAFHVVILLGDPYIGYQLQQLLTPFGSTPYEPFWVGLGQLALYLALPVTFSFYVRRRIGVRTWRLLHYGSFAVVVLVLAHGLGAGTDAQSPALLTMYLLTGSTLVFLTIYRVLTATGRRTSSHPSAPLRNGR
jgi:predicted ferric reductase